MSTKAFQKYFIFFFFFVKRMETGVVLSTSTSSHRFLRLKSSNWRVHFSGHALLSYSLTGTVRTLFRTRWYPITRIWPNLVARTLSIFLTISDVKKDKQSLLSSWLASYMASKLIEIYKYFKYHRNTEYQLNSKSLFASITN